MYESLERAIHVNMQPVNDVVIIGAGIAGINAAYRIQSTLPIYKYAILEARDDIGGTWDLFKYPGVRSDSDLFTFGFEFNPWKHGQPIAGGPAIQDYIRDTAHKFGIDQRIMFRHRLVAADWQSDRNVWSLSVVANGQSKLYETRFVILATGFIDYQEPLKTHIPGIHNFQGPVIKPQFWPDKINYSGRNIAIIGSGATAITLVPKLAEKASRVTMIQRSPTYILSLPNWKWKASHQLQRTVWIFVLRGFFLFCRWLPLLSSWLLKLAVQIQLPSNINYDPHFKPDYKPWDQRLCIAPNGDFFRSLRLGKADIRTDTIKTITADSIVLSSGEEIEADIIIQATGLKLQVAGGSSVSSDGQKVNLSEKYLWNGVMLQDIPNAFYIFGYTNTSWTLGVDTAAHLICRLLSEMEKRGNVAAVPRVAGTTLLRNRRLINLSSTYIALAEHILPKAADQSPWKPRDHYVRDLEIAQHGDITNCLQFVQSPGLRSQHDVAHKGIIIDRSSKQ